MKPKKLTVKIKALIMTIRDWMKQNIIDTKARLQEEEVEILEQRVYNSPALDEESEREPPSTNLYKKT